MSLVPSRQFSLHLTVSKVALHSDTQSLKAEFSSTPSEPAPPCQQLSVSQVSRSCDKAQDAESLLSVGLPSNDPSKPMPRISVSVSKGAVPSENVFNITSNIQHGEGASWRKLFSYFKTLALADGHDDAQDNNLPTSMNASLIRQFLSQGTRPREITFDVVVESGLVPTILPFLPQRADMEVHNATYPSGQLHLTIRAPEDYSWLTPPDLCLTLSDDFLSQANAHSCPSDSETAFVLQWIAVNMAYDKRHIYVDTLLSFTDMLRAQFNVSHDSLLLREGMRLLQAAITHSADSDTDRSRLINNLAVLIVSGLMISGATEDVDNALQWCTDQLLPDLSHIHPAIINNLGLPYAQRYEMLGRLDDLNTNIRILQTSLQYTSTQEPQRTNVLYNLARVLPSRFRRMRDSSDIELAMVYSREALDLEARGVGQVLRWDMLLTFADIYREADDFEGEVLVLRESLSLCPASSRYRVLAALARALTRRYNASKHRDRSMVNEIIQLQTEALEIAPDDDPVNKADMMIQDANLRYTTDRTGFPEGKGLEKIISMAHHALELFGRSADRYLALGLLGQLYFCRFTKLRNSEDLRIALRHTQDAIDVSRLGIGLHCLADDLAYLAEIYMEPGTEVYSLETAYRYLDECLNEEHSDAMSRLQYLRRTLSSALRRTPDDRSRFFTKTLTDLYLKAVRLLPQVASLGLPISASLDSLRGWERTATDASVLCQLEDRNVEAIQILEEGRAVFWSQALRMRPKFADNLPADKYERLLELSQQLEAARYTSVQNISMSVSIVDGAATLEDARRRRLAEEHDALIRQIRDLPGCEDFLSVSPEEIVRVGEHGPVVILVSHDYKCSAYVLTRREDSSTSFKIVFVPLGGLNRRLLQQLVKHMDIANQDVRRGIDHAFRDAGEDFAELKSLSLSDVDPGIDRAYRRTQITDMSDTVLRPLWDHVVKPIVQALNLEPSRGRERPRLWWCPTSEYTFLPIHAAGNYGPNGDCCSNYFVSSYTPTLSALITARKTHRPVRTKGAKFLLAAVPYPFEGPLLRGTVTEMRQIAEVIPADQRLHLPAEDDTLVNPRAGVSIETMIENLPKASFLHLASHGMQDHINPLDSGFILRDAKLTIAKLMPLPLPHAFMAFLSACETAKGDSEQTDQAIHLAATMLFAGFKSVIGTMWNMSDLDGPRVAKHIYEHILNDDEDFLETNAIPYALDDAVQSLRGLRVSPSRWALFIHLGM